ncbi:MAG: TonB-dependent receptor, partial [Bryobacteraceae bacterium]
LYDYVRNDAFNANKFFNNANGLPKEVLKRNQFGGTFGGPVLVPKVLTSREKLFFFYGYQGQRQSSLSTTSAVTTFTPAELGGDFSKSNNGTPDPDVVAFLQQNPYFQPNPNLASQGIIDPTRISSVSKNYIKAGLILSSASGAAIFQGAATSNADEYTGKVDYLVTSSDRISLTLGYQDLPSLIPFFYSNTPGFPVTSEVKRSYGNIAYTKTFSATLLNDFRFTAQRNNNFQLSPAAKAPTGPQLGVGITPDHATGPTLIELYGVGTTMGFSPNGPTALIDNTYNWSDTLTWLKGRHTMKAGGWYTPYQNNTVYDYYVNGDFFFYGPGSTFLNNDKAAFIMGLPDEYLQFPEAPSNIRTYNTGFFAQDEWRVSSRLTLNYGIRYEYSSPKYDTQGRSFSLKFGQQSTVFPGAPLGELFPGDPGAPRGANLPDKNDFAPRVGIAYDPSGNGKMSIRAGFGVFYDILKAEDNLQFNGQAPFFGFADLYFNPLDPTSTTAPTSMSDPYGAAGAVNPFPSKPPAKDINFDAAGFLPVGGGGVYFVNPHLRTPYVYQYNLSIERDLGWGNILDLAYVGSSSHKLTGLYDANPFVLGTNTRLFNTQPGVPSYGFSYLDTFDNIGKAHYNSLEVGLKRRGGQIKYFGSLFYQISYTYGRSMDNSSGFRARNSQVPYYNHDQFYAPSDYDLEHYVSINGAWELPFAQWFSKAPHPLTKGWTLYPVLSYRSGLPIDVLAGLTTSRKSPGTSGAGDAGISRANLVAPMTFYDPKNPTTLNGVTGNYYFDPASFSNAAFLDPNFDPVSNASQRSYGSLGRNAFRGPTRTNINVTLAKITPLWGERVKSEFRADSFNVLNSAQFDNPNNTISSPLFGQISTTGDPRIIQLALRLSF